MKAAVVRSREVKAIRKELPAAPRDTKEAEFVALLRGKVVRAASIGALTAAAESLPGLGKALGLVFGELLDVEMLASTQRALIEETFALYELRLPAPLHNTVLRNVQFVGAGASVAGDALARGLLHRLFGSLGKLVAARAVPVAAVFSSALANASVTYAIGKRAQAVARLRRAPIEGMPDAVRAFTGIDERRIFAWSLAAAKDALSAAGNIVSRVARAARSNDKQSSRAGAKRAKRAKRSRRK